MKHYLSIIMLLVSPLCAWSADGDTFVAQTPEGCSMTFTVISEQEKTACVGNEYDVAIDSETSGKVTIPSVANGYKVTRVSTRAFLLCNQLEEVVIPQGITSIGDLAFDSCEKLRHVNLPEGVKSIGQSAFAFCGELKSVTIPSTVTEFGLWIFLECRSLQEVHSLIQIPSPELPETFSANHPPQPDETMTRVGNHEDWEFVCAQGMQRDLSTDRGLELVRKDCRRSPAGARWHELDSGIFTWQQCQPRIQKE